MNVHSIILKRPGHRRGCRFCRRDLLDIMGEEKQSMNADDVLDQIKAAFLKEGPIEGSWINFEKQPFVNLQ